MEYADTVIIQIRKTCTSEYIVSNELGGGRRIFLVCNFAGAPRENGLANHQILLSH